MFEILRAKRMIAERRRLIRPRRPLPSTLLLEPLEERQLLHANPLQQALVSFHGADLVGKDGPMAKVGFDLALLYEQHVSGVYLQPGTAYSAVPTSYLDVDAAGEKITLQLTGSGDMNAFRDRLSAVGMTDIAVAGSIVNGTIAIDKLNLLAGLDGLQSARPNYRPITAAGLVDSQADAALGSDEARILFGVDGTGVAVGVLSDSFNSLTYPDGTPGMTRDIQTDDLPQDTQILQDAIGTDEGRAMAQHIHDLAPGASILFATALGGQANFANNILALAAAGADVITDDIRYFAEPFFQDGVIAQAAQQVVAQGVPFFSAAFNEGVRSYESAFVDSGQTLESGARLHDFDPGAGVSTLQEIEIPLGGQIIFSFQWDQPFGSLGGQSSTSDLDITLIGADGTTVITTANSANVGNDPLEILTAINDGSFDLDGDGQADTTFFVRIELVSGQAPGILKYVDYGRSATIIGFPTDSSTSVGHANTAGVLGVAASAYLLTPAFGIDPPLLNSFSSKGGTSILFDTAGNRLATPFNPNAPQVTGVDGANTTFFGSDIPQDPDSFPNFFGTSAAAPHLAAVGALMIELTGGPGSVTPDEIYEAMMETAIDIVSRFDLDTQTVIPIPNGQGFDVFSGFGLVDAVAAMQAVNSRISIGDDVALLEGDFGTTDFVFAVHYTGTAVEAVTVAFTTVDVTAVAGLDYVATSGTLTFVLGGPTTQLITVAVIGDLLVESNETFLVRLSSPTNARLGRSEAVGTILNDDIDLSINDASVVEGHTGTREVVFTITAFGEINRPVSASYVTVSNTAQAATDFIPVAGNFSLSPGVNSVQVSVTVLGDRLDEDDETFYVLLTAAQGARIVDGTGVATIIDDDPLPNFYVNDAFITTTSAGVLSAVFTVGLDVPSGRQTSISYGTRNGSAVDGVDFVGQAGSMVFPPGVTTQQVVVPVLTSAGYSSNKKFYLDLANSVNANMFDPEGAATIIYAQQPIGERILDNGEAGFTQSGTWTNLTNTLAYQLDYDYASPGTQATTSTWNFTALPNGSYEVFTRWIPFSNRATNAPYTILDNNTPLATLAVNQQVMPAGDLSNGIVWQSLGTFTITNNTLRVRLANNANGLVIADAVRIVAGGIPAQEPEIDVAFQNVSIDRGDMTPALEDGTDFGSVPSLGVVVSRTFTITNSGNAPLHLSGSPLVSVGGPHASDFTVVTQPAAVIQPGGKTTFQVDFRATGTGIRTGVISITSDDADESVYTFFVRGTLNNPGAVPLAHNASLPQDVNGDTHVTPGDLLLVINALNGQMAAQPLAATEGNFEYPRHAVDVSGDGYVTPRDVLMVINYLVNPPAAPAAAPAVGEPAVAEPLVAEPLVGEPLVAEPLVGEPLVGEPLVAGAVDEALVLFETEEEHEISAPALASRLNERAVAAPLSRTSETGWMASDRLDVELAADEAEDDEQDLLAALR